MQARRPKTKPKAGREKKSGTVNDWAICCPSKLWMSNAKSRTELLLHVTVPELFSIAVFGQLYFSSEGPVNNGRIGEDERHAEQGYDGHDAQRFWGGGGVVHG